MTVTFRPATVEDFAVMGEPVVVRMRATAAEIDGKVVGVAGIGYLPDGAAVAFANLSDDLRKNKIALHKAALVFLKGMRARGVKQIHATADEHIARAPAWLARLGFAPRRVRDKTVWVWGA